MQADSVDDPTRPHVHVLGRLRVVDVRGTERIPQGTAVRTLLILLALNGSSVHVEHALEVLWPDLAIAQGRQRLRNVLARLHTQCGPLVTREGNTLVLHATTDIAAYNAAIATLLVHAGQEIAPEARYADWAEAARRRLQVAGERLAALM